MHRTLLACAVAIAAAAMLPSAALAWAPASSATVHPGVMTYTEGAQCTANFIYTAPSTSTLSKRSGRKALTAVATVDTYIGQAAHCSGTGAATETDGCDSASLPIGTPVEVDGASRPGTMVYNSWLAMQAAGETDSATCAYNDLALIKLDPADVAVTNPSVPGFGGPTGLASLGDTGSTVYTYGNSSLRGGVTTLSPKQGVVVGRDPSGWSTDVYTATPGIPGDSGSGFLTADGEAGGTLSTVQIAPLAGSNGVGDLPLELAYMRAHGGPQANVVNGTEPFNPDLVAAILGS